MSLGVARSDMEVEERARRRNKDIPISVTLRLIFYVPSRLMTCTSPYLLVELRVPKFR